MSADTAPAEMLGRDLFELVAGTMADRRRELINEPLARIWPELAHASVTAVDAYRFAFQSPAEARALAAEAALATAREDAITAYASHIDVALRDYDDNLRYGDDALGPEFFVERGMERAASAIRAQIAAPGAAMEAP